MKGCSVDYGFYETSQEKELFMDFIDRIMQGAPRMIFDQSVYQGIKFE